MAEQQTSSRPKELLELRVDSWSHLNSDKPVPHSHALKISRFKQCLEQYETSMFISDSFTVTVAGVKTSWEFRVYPNGYDDENSNFLGIFVKHKEGNSNRYLIKSVIQLLDSHGHKKVAVDLPGKVLSSKQMHGTKKYIERESLMSNTQLYVEDSITFLLEAEICQPGTRTSAVEDGGALEGRGLEQRRTVEAMEKMGGDLLGLLEEGDYSDVLIQCEGRHFKCHKAILSSRSPVFRAMFQHKSMLEQQKNAVDIQDLSAATVERMLKYVYSGRMDMMDDMCDLLAAADKYDLKELKSSCEMSLSESLSNQNAVDLLILADRHTSHDLRKAALDFLLSNLSSVVKRDTWQEKLKSYPDIMAQIIQAMAGNKTSPSKPKRRKKERIQVGAKDFFSAAETSESEEI